MRAAVLKGKRSLAIEKVPVPELGLRDVLIEVSHCGVCGTDLHMVLEGMGRPGSIGGHEYSGRIVALGADVSGWELGTEVIGGPEARCGRCPYCRRGRPSLCEARPGLGGESKFQGAFAEFVAVHESQLLRVPASLSLRQAALTEPLAVALHALTLSEVEAGQRVLVTGAGPLGLLVVAALHARGVRDITVSEPAPARLERAGKVGATRRVRPAELETPVMPYALVDEPYDVAIECSGRPEAMESALGQLGPMGRLVLVGTGLRRPRLDHNRILLCELVVTGAFTYDEDGFAAALDLLASGRLPVDLLIEARDVAFEGMFEALEALEAGTLVAKVMIAPRKEA